MNSFWDFFWLCLCFGVMWGVGEGGGGQTRAKPGWVMEN
jgi:hypothetical protein